MEGLGRRLPVAGMLKTIWAARDAGRQERSGSASWERRMIVVDVLDVVVTLVRLRSMDVSRLPWPSMVSVSGSLQISEHDDNIKTVSSFLLRIRSLRRQERYHY